MARITTLAAPNTNKSVAHAAHSILAFPSHSASPCTIISSLQPLPQFTYPTCSTMAVLWAKPWIAENFDSKELRKGVCPALDTDCWKNLRTPYHHCTTMLPLQLDATSATIVASQMLLDGSHSCPPDARRNCSTCIPCRFLFPLQPPRRATNNTVIPRQSAPAAALLMGRRATACARCTSYCRPLTYQPVCQGGAPLPSSDKGQWPSTQPEYWYKMWRATGERQVRERLHLRRYPCDAVMRGRWPSS